MKIIFGLLLIISAGGSANAQSYSINWHKVAGGGGTSTNAQYSVSGTIGQPDASATPLAGGNFSVTGGFWSLVSVVQTPDAPLLSIQLTATNTAVIYWPFPSTGFTLQQNTNLSTPTWVTSSQVVTNDGAINYTIVQAPTGNCFYRLAKP